MIVCIKMTSYPEGPDNHTRLSSHGGGAAAKTPQSTTIGRPQHMIGNRCGMNEAAVCEIARYSARSSALSCKASLEDFASGGFPSSPTSLIGSSFVARRSLVFFKASSRFSSSLRLMAFSHGAESVSTCLFQFCRSIWQCRGRDRDGPRSLEPKRLQCGHASECTRPTTEAWRPTLFANTQHGSDHDMYKHRPEAVHIQTPDHRSCRAVGSCT